MRRRSFLANLATASALYPRCVFAQPVAGRRYRLAIATEGVTADIAESGGAENWVVFLRQLHEDGYVENQNLVIERYGAEGRVAQYATIAQAIVRSNPDVAVALATIGLQLLRASDATPVVAALLDPVGMGLVQSLAHPGKNFTGITVDAGPPFSAKASRSSGNYCRACRAWESLPLPSRVADFVVANVTGAAQKLGIESVPARPELPLNEFTYHHAFASLVEAHVDAMFVTGAPENVVNERTIVELAAETRLPAIYAVRSSVAAGGLVSYGFDPPELFRHMANQVDAILKGAKPGDIPIYQPTKFQLFINLKTAKALGLTVPPTILARADEVIE